MPGLKGPVKHYTNTHTLTTHTFVHNVFIDYINPSKSVLGIRFGGNVAGTSLD